MATVSLEAIVRQLDMASDSLQSYLHLPSGEILEYIELPDEWFAFRRAALVRIARDWLELNAVPCRDDAR